MKTALIVCSIVLLSLSVLFFAYLMIIMPSKKKREEMKKYKGAKFAHRGLHNAERAENSMSAFAAAVEAGYGIELDIRLSLDGELVVFHDDTLERVTEEEGRVDSKTAAELAEIKLCGTNDGIPTFREVLELVGGRVPLLVEIKEDAYKYGVTEKAAEILADYDGEYIVESFNPLSITRFRQLVPGIPTGLLCTNYLREKKYRKIMYFALQNMLLNFRCRPDFIAYNHSEWRNAAISLVRFFFSKTPLFCWTLRSAEEERQAAEHGFTGFIFENYESELK
ncbi:MAG: glycerophosphodiester phosphodiesterase [Clostridia bacterium]|nr:glycerophosphodiester phosphodiesterase [Clostridia bacterium]